MGTENKGFFLMFKTKLLYLKTKQCGVSVDAFSSDRKRYLLSRVSPLSAHALFLWRCNMKKIKKQDVINYRKHIARKWHDEAWHIVDKDIKTEAISYALEVSEAKGYKDIAEEAEKYIIERS